MSWFVFALIATLGWGFADLFYKKGAEDNDRYSHLQTAIWVGIVMGAVAIVLCFIPSEEKTITLSNFFIKIFQYSPASLGYIISMVIGYAGMRYLELSIISPVQNASGAFSAFIMIVWFVIRGKDLSEEYSALDIIGNILIVVGIVALAIVEQKLASAEADLKPEEKKYKMGALALAFPLLYCLFDTLGTAADGILLDDEATSIGIGEIDVLILYGLTFFAAGVIAWIFLLIKTKKVYNPFAKSEKNNGIAACCEEFGQVFYVYAMARNPVLAAPMIASYCIVSVILSRFILKEKLKASQYACVISVIIGIVLLGISEGLSEAE